MSARAGRLRAAAPVTRVAWLAPLAPLVLPAALVAGCAPTDGAERAPVVCAAASTAAALAEVVDAWRAAGGRAVRLHAAGSSTLARQVLAGAPCDLFLSANEAWMDELERADRLEPGTRADLLANRLVWIAPRGAGAPPEPLGPIEPGSPPPAFQGRLSLGDPAHVPAGIYARQALESLGWWSALEPRLLPALDAVAARTWVARGEAGAGVVYATDAAATDGVEVLAVLPESGHDPIRYPVALLRGAPEAARAFLAFLRGDVARSIFRSHGFGLPAG